MHLRLAAATALAAVAIVVRGRFGAPWPWLAMNLVLAWIPVFLGLAARDAVARLLMDASAHDRAFVLTHGALFAAAALVLGRPRATDLKPRLSSPSLPSVIGSVHDRSGREGR